MKILDVRIQFDPAEPQSVGRLAENNNRLYFEYTPGFLNSPLRLSPFKLPPVPGLHEHRDRAFGPVFGLFAGEGRTPGRAELLRLADGAGLGRKEATELIGQVVNSVACWPQFAQSAGLGGKRVREIGVCLGC